jgi:hypothetical protein
MKSQQHIGFWMLLAILGFFFGPILRSGPSMESYLVREIAETREAMGDRIGGMIVGFADGIFQSTPVAAVVRQTRAVEHTRADQELSAKVGGPGGAMMSNLFNSYLQGLILQCYVFAMRLAIVLLWMIALAPLFAATVFDGIMQRSIKLSEMGSLRPATFSLAGFFVIPMLFLPVLYLTLPFSLSPLLAPAWAGLVALPLSLLVSNSQPLFGR